MSVESASDRKRTSGVIGIMRDNGTTVRWVLSVAILISVANFNIAQAQKGGAVASACGKELITHCSGVPVHANNMLECLRKDQEKLSENCATLANRVAFRCRETYFAFAKTLSPVKAAFSDASQRPSVRFPHDAMKLSMRLSCADEN